MQTLSPDTLVYLELEDFDSSSMFLAPTGIEYARSVRSINGQWAGIVEQPEPSVTWSLAIMLMSKFGPLLCKVGQFSLCTCLVI